MPFDLMSSLLYLGVLAPYLYSFVIQSGYELPVRWWQAAFMIVFTSLLLTADRQEATLILRDNGHGFDASSWQQVAPGRNGGYGLQGLQERLELLRGRLQIGSAPGQGTMLRVTLLKNGASLITDGRLGKR